MIANWVKQKTSTTGTGDVLLDTTLNGFIRFADAFPNKSVVFYTLFDGNDKEMGVGTFYSSTNTITRDTILETLVNGVYTSIGAGPTPITLGGTATIGVTDSVQGNTTTYGVWNQLDTQLSAQGVSVPATFKNMISALIRPAFDPTINNSLMLTANINHDMSKTEGMYPFISWSPSDSHTGTVRWGIDYTVANSDTEAFSATNTIYVEQLATGTPFTHQKAVFAEIDKLASKEPNAIILGRVFRDAAHVNDTYTGDAFLHGVSFNYLMNYLGTPKKVADYYNWG